MTRTLIISILIFSFLDLVSCDCRTKKELEVARQTEFDFSDIVILGEVYFVSSDHMEFKIKVIEVFKGEFVIGQIIEGENHQYCEPNASSVGQWLIYGHIENGKLKTNICGLSRSLEYPENNRYFRAIPPPPKPLYPKDSIKYKKALMNYEKIDKEYLNTAKEEINIEIEILRKKASVQQKL